MVGSKKGEVKRRHRGGRLDQLGVNHCSAQGGPIGDGGEHWGVEKV